MTAPGPARVPLRRLRDRSRSRRPGLVDMWQWAVVTAVCAVLAVGAAGPLSRLLAKAGWAAGGAPGYLFAVAATLLLLGGLARMLRSAGPVTTSSAFLFWLLSAPVRRRDLLRRRYAALVAVIAVIAFLATGLIALTGSVPAAPAAAAAGLAAVALVGGAVCGQAWESADRIVHIAGQATRAAGVLAFGSLATGAGRADLNSALHPPPGAAVIALAVLAVAAIACCAAGYRALEAIDAAALRAGRGLWTAGQAAAVSMDVFVLADFLADQRARQTARVRLTRIGARPAARVRPVRPPAGFAAALARSEWTRLRRRPGLGIRMAAAGIVCWGCGPVLHGPALVTVALITGYFLVLPVAGTLRQLTASPGLRAQFAPRDHWLSGTSIAASLLTSALWAAIITPALSGATAPGGLAAVGSEAALAALIAAGLTAAVYRTVTRPPLDYFGPLVPTGFGDLPLDLWRQLFRGPLLLAVVITVTTLLTIH